MATKDDILKTLDLVKTNCSIMVNYATEVEDLPTAKIALDLRIRRVLDDFDIIERIAKSDEVEWIL